MDIGKSFTYMFEDQDWIKKILIGGVVNLPILNFAATGYFIEALRNTAEGRELPLPEWDDFGGKFIKGLMVAIASFLYMLPMMLVMGVILGLTTAIAGSLDSDAAETVSSICPLMVNCLLFVYMVLFMLIFPAALTRYALTEQFGAFFRFGDIIALIQANIGGYVIALLVAVVAGLIAQIVGGIACGIGILFTLTWAMLVGANLFGNLAREALSTTF